MEAVALSGTAVANAVVEGDSEESETPKVEVLTSSRLGRLVMRAVMSTGVALAIGVLALTVGPRFLPYQTYTVLSGSMEPTLPVGSVIVAVPAQGNELNKGDIITVAIPQRQDMLVTHRIVAVETGPQGRVFKTKGDANQEADSWLVPASGGGWRYAFAIPYLGYVLSALQSGLGRMLLLVVPTLLLGGLLLVEIWRPARMPDKVSDGAMPAGA
ncbi:MAG TPA: signal peptidase I [Chloroflexia bacterium]